MVRHLYSLLGGNLGVLGWGSSLLGLESSVEFSLSLGLLLLQELREELLISNMSLLGSLPVGLLLVLVLNLSSDSLLGNESLDLWGLVEGLVRSLLLGELSSNNVLGNIVLLSKGEGSSDGVGSLWSESSVSWGISETGDLLLSLLDDLKGDDSKIWSADATSDGLSLSLTSPSWSVGSGSFSVKI